MLSEIIPVSVYNELAAQVPVKAVTELRIRVGRPIRYAIGGTYRELRRDGQPLTARQCDVDYIVGTAGKHSLYACNETLVNGYIACEGGIRVGVVGEGVLKNGQLSAVKNFTALCIRIPHEIRVRSAVLDRLTNEFDNTLIVSRPGLGKTTLLRELVRRLSEKGYNVLVLDERFELSGTAYGRAALDLGSNSDVCVGVPKIVAYATLVRSMRPDVLATDEIFGREEVRAVADAIRCGVRVAATLHCNNLAQLKQDAVYGELLEKMRYIVTLCGVGMMGECYDLKGKGQAWAG